MPQLFRIIYICVHFNLSAHTVLSQLVIGCVLSCVLMYVLFFVSQSRKMHLLLSLLFFIGKLGQTVHIHAVQERLSIKPGSDRKVHGHYGNKSQLCHST